MDRQPSPEFLRAFEEAFQKQTAAAMRAEPPAARPPSALHQLAAALTSFEPTTLQYAVGSVNEGELLALLADCEPLQLPHTDQHWTLEADVRVSVLRYLRETSKLHDILEKTRQRRFQDADPMQPILTNYLTGEPVPLTRHTLAQLSFAFQASRWLREAGFATPGAAAIKQRADWLSFLEPFEHLASDKIFAGRLDELDRLRRYAGVQPPRSALERLERRVMENILGRYDQPPLVIHGAGGVGKSTLLARFILEHARAHDQSRFPFIYLDFDRPDVAVNEPLSLLIEGVRQLGIEYPEASLQCERLRADWSARLAAQAVADRLGRAVRGTRYGSLRQSISQDFCNLISTIGAAHLPVLLVLDTFEQVQIRSSEYVANIWSLLDELRTATPRLRVVIAGRAPIAGYKTQELAVTAFDEEAATAYLMSRGIRSSADAHKIYRFVGGTPLALNLALAIMQRDRYGTVEALDHIPFISLDRERVQRQLYKRFLNNLRGDIQRLAHPGLVLRRLTADLVYRVLREPCQLSIESISQARSLLDELRAEVSLVQQDSDGSLRHRQDLRLEMIRLLESDKPEQVRQIHEAAVSYYSAEDGVKWRAEEIYHRLRLGQEISEIDARWLPGVELYLSSALPELSGRSRAYLAAKLELEVDAATTAQAELDDWERIVERRAGEAIAKGRFSSALELLAARSSYSTLSPLFKLKAAALAGLRRYDDALETLDQGAIQAIEQAGWQPARALAIEAADTLLRTGIANSFNTPHVLHRLNTLLDAPGEAVERFGNAIRLVALSDSNQKFRSRSRALFDGLTDDELQAHPETAFWFAAFADARDLKRITRAIHCCGFPAVDQASMRLLAAELADQDLRSDRLLSRDARIEPHSSLTDTWTEFLLTAQDPTIRESLVRILQSDHIVDPARLIEAINSVMRSALGLLQREPPPPEPLNLYSEAAGPTPDAIRPSTQRALINALVAAFRDVATLREFLAKRMNLSIDSISFHYSMEGVTTDLVKFAAKSGLVPQLVVSARESHPDLTSLGRISRELGLTTLIPTAAMVDARARAPHPVSFEWLSAVEGQVCRVEVDSEPRGTAFLVGIDLVLTSFEVIDELRRRTKHPGQFGFRFDFKPGRRGAPLNPGVVFSLHKSWFVASANPFPRDLSSGYALLRLEGAPAAQPIGGAIAEIKAQPRQWLALDTKTAPTWPNEGLVIVHYSGEKPLQLTFCEKAQIDLTEKPGYVQYDTGMQRGSSGAPCLTLNGELVAVHLSRMKRLARRPCSFGLSIQRINADLDTKGLGHLRKPRLA